MKLYNEAKFTFETGEDRKGKGRRFVSKFFEAGIVSYKKQGGLVYLVKKETIDKFIKTIIGCPVIINHDDITDENVKDKAVGYISNVWFNDADSWYYCDGIITDRDAEDLILSDEWSVSCGYVVTEKDEAGGNWHDLEYDAEILAGDFEHLAIVKSPRYREANILLNSTEEKREMLNKMFSAKKLRNAEDEEKETEAKVENESETEDPKKALLDLINSIDENSDEEIKEKLYSKADGLRNMCKNSDEAEKDDEEEKAQNMCKNEADEEKEKEEEKKEPAKLKNSSFDKMKTLKNSVAEIKQPESLYMSEAKRLKLGENY